jgi:Big-like domain-containing protein
MAFRPRSIAVAFRLLLMASAGWLGAGEAAGAQLTASWIDNTSGTAATRLERRLATSTTFVALADVAPGVTEFVDASVSPGTEYCYRAFAFDAAAASAYSDEACGSPAPAVLTLAFMNPASGATVDGRATVSLSASGGTGYTYTVKVDGATIYSGTNPSFSWNTSLVTNGLHTLTASVRDPQSNVGTASRTVTVSNPYSTAVALSFSYPASGATVRGAQSVGLSTTADPGQTKTFTLSVDGAAVTSQTVSMGTTFWYTWDTSRVANGSRTLTATLNVHDETVTATLPVTVSNETAPPPPPPAPLGVAFTTPAAGAVVSGVTTIGMAASGASGPSTFTLVVDGTVVSTQTVAGSIATYVWNTSKVRQGAKTLSLTVTDGSARSATAMLSVTVGDSPCSAEGECSRDGCDSGGDCGHRRDLLPSHVASVDAPFLQVVDDASF